VLEVAPACCKAISSAAQQQTIPKSTVIIEGRGCCTAEGPLVKQGHRCVERTLLIEWDRNNFGTHDEAVKKDKFCLSALYSLKVQQQLLELTVLLSQWERSLIKAGEYKTVLFTRHKSSRTLISFQWLPCK
jgi:hypothetical protein